MYARSIPLQTITKTVPSLLTAATGVRVGKGPLLNLAHNIDSTPGQFVIQTYNKISPLGLDKFPKAGYTIVTEPQTKNTHAILLRSYNLKESEVPLTVRCIARCGAGTNNIPVGRMTEMGIPVFNTPGANANAVKELVLCGLLLASRDIVGGINHMKKLGSQGLAKERVEKDKAMFGGQEVKGKTLGVIGLGHIGAATARDAAALGMSVIGYDPGMNVQSALKLPSTINLVESMKAVFANSDYISLNIPYINKPVAEGGTHSIISRDLFMSMKKNASLLNFARGELVDSEALKAFFDSGATGKYVTDFPDDLLWDHPNALVIPHLGASTEEAEDQAAAMAAATVQQFLETGVVRNSVNFPDTKLDVRADTVVRICLVNENKSGVLAEVLKVLAEGNLNILQQVNRSKGAIAYNVIDVEFDDLSSKGKFKSWAELQESLTMLPNVISTRFMNDVYGSGYAKKVGSSYFV